MGKDEQPVHHEPRCLFYLVFISMQSLIFFLTGFPYYHLTSREKSLFSFNNLFSKLVKKCLRKSILDHVAGDLHNVYELKGFGTSMKYFFKHFPVYRLPHYHHFEISDIGKRTFHVFFLNVRSTDD